MEDSGNEIDVERAIQLDKAYLKTLDLILDEWHSEDDEQAYSALSNADNSVDD